MAPLGTVAGTGGVLWLVLPLLLPAAAAQTAAGVPDNVPSPGTDCGGPDCVPGLLPVPESTGNQTVPNPPCVEAVVRSCIAASFIAEWEISRQEAHIAANLSLDAGLPQSNLYSAPDVVPEHDVSLGIQADHERGRPELPQAGVSVGKTEAELGPGHAGADVAALDDENLDLRPLGATVFIPGTFPTGAESARGPEHLPVGAAGTQGLPQRPNRQGTTEASDGTGKPPADRHGPPAPDPLQPLPAPLALIQNGPTPDPVPDRLLLAIGLCLSALLLWPLSYAWSAASGFFTRLRKDSLFEQRARSEILDAIRANPWSTLVDLQRSTSLSRSTLRYHLRVLGAHRLVLRMRAGRQARFADASTGRPTTFEGPVQRLLRAELEQGPRRMERIVGRLVQTVGYSRAGAWKALQAAVRRGLVRAERRGNQVWLEIPPHV